MDFLSSMYGASGRGEASPVAKAERSIKLLGLNLGCTEPFARPSALGMTKRLAGEIAVIFISSVTGADPDGYAAAAAAMESLAAAQPGYRGIDSARGADGMGITVSYWADETAAVAWRKNEEHAAIRERGRDVWYSSYSLHVAAVARSYDWQKP